MESAMAIEIYIFATLGKSGFSNKKLTSKSDHDDMLNVLLEFSRFHWWLSLVQHELYMFLHYSVLFRATLRSTLDLYRMFEIKNLYKRRKRKQNLTTNTQTSPIKISNVIVTDIKF